MTRRMTGGLCALALLGAAWPAQAAQAAQVCAWIVESADKEGLHQFDLYLQADGEADVYYMMKGQGVTTENSRTYSPGKGTYVLHRGRTAKVWGFGTNVDAGADIDIVAEIHEYPKDIFDEKEPPLLGAATLRRHVPDDETTVPKAGPAARQCFTAPPPRPPGG